MEKQRCKLCNSEMDFVERRNISNTEYSVFKCKNCKHTIATSSAVQ